MLVIDSILFNCSISNIIITNKNNIAIAPTYTITIIKGTKLNPNSKRVAELFKKTNTNQNTECIGFKEVITIIAPNNVIKVKNI